MTPPRTGRRPCLPRIGAHPHQKSRRFLLSLLLAGVTMSAAAAESAGASLRWTKRHLLTSPHENATVADLNRDGHVDIISGSFIFDGPNFVPRMYRPNHLASDYLRENSVHAWDVDRDGWLDII